MSTQTLELALPHSFAGRTLRWKFNDGPTAGTEYEKPARKPTPIPYASYEVAAGWHFVSYLSPDSGYTLTVLVNTTDGVLHGVASSEKEWYPLTGTLLK